MDETKNVALLTDLADLLILHQAVAEYVIFGSQLHDALPAENKEQARDLLDRVNTAVCTELAEKGYADQAAAALTLTQSVLDLDRAKTAKWGKGGGHGNG